VGQHSSAWGSALLGLDGFQLVSAELVDGEWQLVIQTTATVIGCAGCGVPAKPRGRRTVRVRDLPIGGRPVVLAWRKRLWRCHEPVCGVRTWTERAPAIGPRAVLTERARAEACRRVGKDAHAVAAVARDLGVGWATIMRAVARAGRSSGRWRSRRAARSGRITNGGSGSDPGAACVAVFAQTHRLRSGHATLTSCTPTTTCDCDLMWETLRIASLRSRSPGLVA
jgi:hypothetical protein